MLNDGEQLWKEKAVRHQMDPQTRLLQGVNENDLEDVAWCLKQEGVTPNSCRTTENQWSLLHLVACRTNIAMAQMLIDHGADLNACTVLDETPLHFAAEQDGSEAEEMVRLLLKHGANVNHRAKTGQEDDDDNPDYGGDDDEEDPSDTEDSEDFRIMKDPGGPTPLLIAVEEENVNICNILLHHRADPNVYDSRGLSPLHHAVKKKNQHMTKALLTHGADPNFMPIWANEYSSPLHLAASTNFELSDLLMAHGGDVQQPDSNGDLPLHLAVKAGERTVRLFLHHMLLHAETTRAQRAGSESGEGILVGRHDLQDESKGDPEWAKIVEGRRRGYSGLLSIKNKEGMTPLDFVPSDLTGTDPLRLAFFGGVRSLKEYCGLFLLDHQTFLSRHQTKKVMEKKLGHDLVVYLDTLARRYCSHRFNDGLFGSSNGTTTTTLNSDGKKRKGKEGKKEKRKKGKRKEGGKREKGKSKKGLPIPRAWSAERKKSVAKSSSTCDDGEDRACSDDEGRGEKLKRGKRKLMSKLKKSTAISRSAGSLFGRKNSSFT